jgi:OOP family OmpA-OmpF porin
MKKSFLLFLLFTAGITAYAQTTPNDGNWASQKVTLQNTPEAEFMVRIGDIDNLGFGWPEAFDPFCERVLDSHNWPWEAAEGEVAGTDRILVSSKYNRDNPSGCGGDGYSGSFDPVKTNPVPYTLPTDYLKTATIRDAFLMLFIDDFQAPGNCSKFQLTLNGTRFVEAEKVLNLIDQSGPVGKLVTIRIPEEFYSSLQSGSVAIKIDESSGAADGWAVDFVKLIVNRKLITTCKGTAYGYVLDKESGEPIAGASVTTSYGLTVKTDEAGHFEIPTVPSGLEPLRANAAGYAEGGAGADVGKGDDNPSVNILLDRAANTASFDGKNIKAGETLVMGNILFDQGSAELRPESKTELDKIVAFLKTNPAAEIELSGHTSSEGDAAFNRSLSYRRVKSCKDYIVSRGTDTGRIVAVGHGPDKPIAPNDSEGNRAKNRRVEMRVVKL